MLPTQLVIESADPITARLVALDSQVNHGGNGTFILTYVASFDQISPYDAEDILAEARDAVQQYAVDNGLLHQENISIGVQRNTQDDTLPDDFLSEDDLEDYYRGFDLTD